ncbi:hypothetical protein JT55_02705 [Rhodovulum sp. NI22]|nr:hypothetical protein JT55_02705 [Rhodovulum sp. NI22]
MAGGVAPTKALQSWQDQARAIVALNRRNRRQLRALNITEILAHPAAFRDRFDLPEGSGPGGLLRNDQDNLFLLTLAQQMLHDDAQNRLLMAELEAISISLSKAPPASAVDPEAVFLAYQSSRATQDKLQELTEHNRELGDALERMTAQSSALESAERQQADALQKARQGIALLQAQNQELQDEFKALLEQKADLAEQLQAQKDETSAARQQAKHQEDLNAELARKLSQSEEGQRTSGNVVRLLQTQGRELQDELETLARRNIQLEATAAKLPELNRKLTQARETLQARLAEKERSLSSADDLMRQMKAKQTALRAELARLGVRVTDSQATTAEKEARIAGLEDELGQLRDALGRAEDEVRRIYASRSYRITGPLRRIRTFFSGRTPV